MFGFLFDNFLPQGLDLVCQPLFKSINRRPFPIQPQCCLNPFTIFTELLVQSVHEWAVFLECCLDPLLQRAVVANHLVEFLLERLDLLGKVILEVAESVFDVLDVL